MASAVRAAVGPTRWPISVVTGRPEKIEVPRSPRATLASQMPAWARSGRSSPRRARIFSMSWLVA